MYFHKTTRSSMERATLRSGDGVALSFLSGLCKLGQILYISVSVLLITRTKKKDDNVYYDLNGSSLTMFCSSHLWGCYCHPDYLRQLVRPIRQTNLS